MEKTEKGANDEKFLAKIDELKAQMEKLKGEQQITNRLLRDILEWIKAWATYTPGPSGPYG